MIPNWKLKRELTRIKQQFHAYYLLLIEPWKRYYYVKHIHNKQLITDGVKQSTLTDNYGFGKKIALFLIYQPTGLNESTYKTCQHLINKGYSILAVCNHSLNPIDKNLLIQYTAKIIERPNFGYDFGGYKDGILYLKSLNIVISNLIILNDSIWYPITPEDNLIERMEYSSASFLGALYMQSNKFKWVFKSNKSFFGSFFLMIKQDIYESDIFLQFWLKYPSTNSKYLTIKRGEQKLSATLLKYCPKYEWFYDKNMLHQYIDHANHTELLKLLKYSITLDKQAITTKDTLLEKYIENTAHIDTTNPDYLLKEKNWCKDTRVLLKHISNQQNILSTLPILPITQLGVSYLKKSLDSHNRLALSLIVQEHLNLKLNLDPIILNEIKSKLSYYDTYLK